MIVELGKKVEAKRKKTDLYTKRSLWRTITYRVENTNTTNGKWTRSRKHGIFLWIVTRFRFKIITIIQPTQMDKQVPFTSIQSLCECLKKPGKANIRHRFSCPKFKDGKVVKPAYMTVFHNGVLVQHNRELIGSTTHKVLAISHIKKKSRFVFKITETPFNTETLDPRNNVDGDLAK